MKKIEVKTKCGETFTFEVDTNQEIESMQEVVKPVLEDVGYLFENVDLKYGEGWRYRAIPARGPSATNGETTGTLIWVHNVSKQDIGIIQKQFAVCDEPRTR